MQIIITPRQSSEYYANAIAELKKIAGKDNPCNEKFCHICAKSHGDLINFVQSLKAKVENENGQKAAD